MSMLSRISLPAAVLLAISTTAHAAFLTTDPSPAVIQPGETLEVSLETESTFGEWSGVQMDLTYDADVLSYQTTTFNSLIDDLTAPQSEPPGASGVITIQGISGTAFLNDPGGSGAGTLATMVFQAVAPGFTDVAITGTGGTLIVPGFNAELAVGATVVPLPAPILLFLSGLAGIAGYVRFGRWRGTADATA